MTEEQIKQNAEQYAENEWGKFRNADDWISVCIDGYIAGANSRDEEIKKYKNRIQELQRKLIELGEF